MSGFFSKIFKKDEKNKTEEIIEIEETELSDEEIEKMLQEDNEEDSGENSSGKYILEQDFKKSAVNEQAEQDEPEEKVSFFKKLTDGLFKTRKSITERIDGILSSFKSIDEELFEELEEILITADVGVETALKLVEQVRKKVKEQKIKEPMAVKQILKEEIMAIMESPAEKLGLNTPEIVLVIGVNGVGKTTSIGKLSYMLKKSGKKVLIAAADTFRAAAIDQLEIWANRSGVDIIKHQEGADPAAVIFDAINAAKSRKIDVLICDTAGRLHNKKNLMEELKKIFRVIEREYPEAHKEVLLILDATTGQNAIAQAKIFKEAADITGIILTKLDGTAKGGIVIAIKSELNIPVRFVGVGEKINDLQEFNAKDFVNALFLE